LFSVACTIGRRDSVALFEVAATQRVNEVIGDVDLIEDLLQGFCIACVGNSPPDAACFLARSTRDGEYLVLLRQQRQECLTNGAGGAEHSDLHRSASRHSRAK
jgi:hypothetical protein